MLIDDNSKIAMLSKSFPGSELLFGTYIKIWFKLLQFYSGFQERNGIVHFKEDNYIYKVRNKREFLRLKLEKCFE